MTDDLRLAPPGAKPVPALVRRRPREAADAALRDAAPELLACLKHFVHWHDQLQPWDIARAEAIIAKAEAAQ